MSYYDLKPVPQFQEPLPPTGPEPASRALWRGFWSGVFAFIALAALGLSVALLGYAYIARDLPAPNELRQRASSFRSTRIYDRTGELLNEAFDPNEGRRVEVPLERISPYLIQATIATEDANFYTHAGVDPVALLRLIYYAILERDFVSGGSTITQQLVKRLFLTPEQTLTRKVKEGILAAEITRRYDKDEILEIYLNELFYGSFAYGIDAAAETYFGKDVAELSLAEAALLAGLPQLPAYYDPYTYPDRAKTRQGVVLGLMVENGDITQAQADGAWDEPLLYIPLAFDLKAPHFTLLVRQQLESLLGPDALYRAGLEVTTSLDPKFQAEAERIVAEQVAALADRNVSNGALVAMNPTTGEILALVGSADFNNVEIDGQVNMALTPRQPGSSTKPFVYLSAFEQPDKPLAQRWTPGTLVADVESPFPDGVNPDYVPRNYDEKEHGMVTVGAALANSYNIPAVRALQAVGLPYYMQRLRDLGITTLAEEGDYGLSLSLGGAEVPLLELTGAFAVLANGGLRQPPVAIIQIADNTGNVICQLGSATPCQIADATAGRQVIDPVDAFLITDMLRDNDARTPTFGANSALNLGRPAAAKTGTTNDYRDNLTVGYTPQIVTGVWVGNADNTPMRNVSGVAGAGPIWNLFMKSALADQPVVDFVPPAGVELVEVCADTGTRPSAACPAKTQHWFAVDRPPLPPEADLWQIIRIDKVTGKLATEFTPAEQVEEKPFKLYPPEYREWAEQNGIAQPPTEASDLFTFAPVVNIQQPLEGAAVAGIVQVVGSADVSSFASYELQYGISHDPGAFSAAIWGPVGTPVRDNVLGQWDTRTLTNGPHTLRVLVRDSFGTQVESRVRVTVNNPTPTEIAPTFTPTWTPVPVEEVPATPTPLLGIYPPPLEILVTPTPGG
ncbi:MAG: transglycosylase domain-containing protein [Caldilineaceae bacterium]|nr:transglycosylase domain-containing protein [Caldilineaceae bacterium]